MDLLAHAIAERAVHQLVALDPAQALECRTDDQRLEMLPVAVDLDLVAGKSGLDRALDVVGSESSGPQLVAAFEHLERHHRERAQQVATTAKLIQGAMSDKPKKP